LAENTNKVGSAKKYHKSACIVHGCSSLDTQRSNCGGGGAQQAKLWSEARIEAPRPTGCQGWQRQFNCRFKKGKDSEEKREKAAKKRKSPGLKNNAKRISFIYFYSFFLL
jgi:hypothetical protein